MGLCCISIGGLGHCSQQELVEGLHKHLPRGLDLVKSKKRVSVVCRGGCVAQISQGDRFCFYFLSMVWNIDGGLQLRPYTPIPGPAAGSRTPKPQWPSSPITQPGVWTLVARTHSAPAGKHSSHLPASQLPANQRGSSTQAFIGLNNSPISITIRRHRGLAEWSCISHTDGYPWVSLMQTSRVRFPVGSKLPWLIPQALAGKLA